MNSCSESLNKPDGHLAFNSFPLRASLKCRNFIGKCCRNFTEIGSISQEKHSNKESFHVSTRPYMHNCISTIRRTRRLAGLGLRRAIAFVEAWCGAHTSVAVLGFRNRRSTAYD